jgi:alginate O-acetyltransferase complex protein AlgI
MLFSSASFFAFFIVYFLFHTIVPRQYRVYLIICGSTIFYAWWKVEYVWLPYLLMGIAYGGAKWVSAADHDVVRRRRTIATLVVLFLPLLVFKYTNFLYGAAVAPFAAEPPKLIDWSLPLGVSFVTFTLTAYVVDIAQRRYPPDQSPATVLGYTLFFPHLIAGPILRPVELIPQLRHPRVALSIRPAAAIAIITLGLVKKLVFADPIAAVVDAVYADSQPTAAAALLAIYGFGAQIYCDFSGYTDMAIGLAMLLGIRLPNNFARPYAASSLIEFWRRWHITLSLWFRDYVYIPLGGNRDGRLKETRNLLITMVLAGLWHGANWTFLIWGLLHGLGIAALHAIRGIGKRSITEAVPTWLAVLLTFHAVTLAWVFFRASSIAQAWMILRAPFIGGGWDKLPALAAENAFVLVLMAVFFALHRLDDHRHVKLAIRRCRPEIVWPVIALGWIMAITVSHGNSAKFVYFDF